MKLINANREKIAVEFTFDEFMKIKRLIAAVHNEYGALDEVLLDLSEKEIEQLSDDLSDILKKWNFD
jgi:hypothetical protein